MSLSDLLRSARNLGFTKIERHEVGDVYRANYRAAKSMLVENPDALAYRVAWQFMFEQIDKWQRLDYVLRGEGLGYKHRRRDGTKTS